MGHPTQIQTVKIFRSSGESPDQNGGFHGNIIYTHKGFFIATFDYWRRFFWKCATFNQSCQWARIGPILASLGHMVDQIREVTLLTSLVFGSKHPTQFSSSRMTRAVMQGKGHATMGFATIKWTTCNPKWPNNGIFSNVQLA